MFFLLLLLLGGGGLRRLGREKKIKKSRIQRIKSALQASSLVPLPLAHLVLSKELDVEAAVSQFWILLNRKYIVAIVALYFT